MRVGDFDLESELDPVDPRDYHIISVTDYGLIEYTNENDVALVKVDRPIFFTGI